MSRLAFYLVPFYLSFWGLGRDIPGIGLSTTVVGTLTLFLLSVPLFWNKPIRLRHQWFFIGFVLLHVLWLNPFGVRWLDKLDFSAKVVAAFLFFAIVVNLARTLERYSKMIGVLLATTTAVMLVLVYFHLVVFESSYLSKNLTAEELYYLGRQGKNSMAFFLAVVFPFAYARFTHQRNTYNLIVLVVIAFATVYTISRMALVSLVTAILLFAVIGLKRARYRRQLVAGGLTAFVVFPVVFEIDLVNTFLRARSPATIAEVESGERRILEFGAHRYQLLLQSLDGFIASPIIGQGAGSFRDDGRSDSHNDYGRILYELGLVGFLLAGSIVWFSFRDLRSCKRLVPPEHGWLLDGQIVSLVSTAAMLLVMNAYHTLPVWFVLAGAQVIPLSIRHQMTQRL